MFCSLFQTRLAAWAKAGELANALLLGCVPELLRRVNIQLLVKTHSGVHPHVADAQQAAHAARQREQAQVVIEGHCAGLHQLGDPLAQALAKAGMGNSSPRARISLAGSSRASTPRAALRYAWMRYGLSF